MMRNDNKRIVIKLAGVSIEVRSGHPFTANMLKDYLVEGDGTECLVIDVTDAEILKEAARESMTEAELGDPQDHAYFEYQAIYRKIVESLPERDVFMIHGSAVAVDGEAYLFTAPSGTGKSTHTKLWRDRFGERAVMVNDDKPLVRFEDGRAVICGSPWRGKHRLGSNIQVPLKAICYLERAEVNSIERLTPEDAFEYIYRQTYRPYNEDRMEKTLELIDRLLSVVPVYKMYVNNFAGDAGEVAYSGMNLDMGEL